ncbi:MAG: glutamine-hydrolyzing carbamoyl-phosphate synthase small subunit [Hyphomonadaceae bacterium]
MSEKNHLQAETTSTGVIVLADGTAFFGEGCGGRGVAIGELCFNTAVTGYQEILTDPSYAAQIVLFTFPHIGNVGANADDHEESTENASKAAVGTLFRAPITPPSNHRATDHFDAWLTKTGIIGLSGIDTRALTIRIREQGMSNAAIAHSPDGKFDIDALAETARNWPGLQKADLAKDVSQADTYANTQTNWHPETGFSDLEAAKYHVVVMDFGVKKNILRNLATVNARATIVSGDTTYDEIAALNPDGVVLSNGPGDPAATFERAGDTIKALVSSGTPLLGICLGHQMLALALGAKTMKMAQGHHGANHPVKDMTTGKVEIVSMNHGFTVDIATLPEGVSESHRSLFDGTNCGLVVEGKPIISVQHHPEASPGPQDSFYLFDRFAGMMDG